MKKPKLLVTELDYIIEGAASKCGQKTLVVWAADCAARVLPYFEKNFPGDERPRKAIEAGRAWARGEGKVITARKAAFVTHTAARDARKVAKAYLAARAAGHAAATAFLATHALHAAIYAATAVREATSGEGALAERQWQHQHLLDLQKVSAAQ